MENYIIGIAGKIGSGKTTFGIILQEELQKLGINVEFRNFADKLKQITFDLAGIAGYTQDEKNIFIEEYGMTCGEALQKIGTGLRNTFHSDVWVLSTLKNLKENTVYIIGDCRFPNEADIIKKRNGIVIRLEGDPLDIRANSRRDVNHISETALDDYKDFDVIIQNNQLDNMFKLTKHAILLADSIYVKFKAN